MLALAIGACQHATPPTAPNATPIEAGAAPAAGSARAATGISPPESRHLWLSMEVGRILIGAPANAASALVRVLVES